MAKVDVKLSGPHLVDGVIRQAGEIVELDPKFAADFGEVLSDGPGPLPRPLSAKQGKAALVAEAVRLGVKVSPDGMTNKQIIAAIETAEN